jgi:hypothetical protein
LDLPAEERLQPVESISSTLLSGGVPEPRLLSSRLFSEKELLNQVPGCKRMRMPDLS